MWRKKWHNISFHLICNDQQRNSPPREKTLKTKHHLNKWNLKLESSILFLCVFCLIVFFSFFFSKFESEIFWGIFCCCCVLLPNVFPSLPLMWAYVSGRKITTPPNYIIYYYYFSMVFPSLHVLTASLYSRVRMMVIIIRPLVFACLKKSKVKKVRHAFFFNMAQAALRFPSKGGDCPKTPFLDF